MPRISASVMALLVIYLAGSAPAGAEAIASARAGGRTPTFNKDIAPILFENCSSCHHPGEVAPFALLTYADARKHSSEIAELTQNRQMPPWKPEHGYGQFIGERRLTDEQIDVIQRWVKGGRPEGNAADLPAAPKYSDGWTLGKPDVVVKMPRAYTLKARGGDVQRSFVIPLNIPDDQYVEAVEFHPSNRKIVHHTLFYLDTSGKARAQDGADGEVGFGQGGGLGFIPAGGLGGWVPGMTPRRLPTGVARFMRHGADLVIQTHFHPSGKQETEQSTVALYFAKTPPKDLFISHMRLVDPRTLNIPAGESNFVHDAQFTVPTDVTLQGIFPHAHLVCKEVKVTGTLPGGQALPLIWIKDWDWGWQDDYVYAEPLKIPRGTVIRMHFVYDNSSANEHNPSNPPRRVHWGEQTSDEMAIVFFDLLVDRQWAAAFEQHKPGADSAAPPSRDKLRRWLEAIKKNEAASGGADASMSK